MKTENFTEERRSPDWDFSPEPPKYRT